MRKFFVTGSSKGIGHAITELLLQEPDVEVTGISRTNTLQNKRFVHIPLNLEDVVQLAADVDGIFNDHTDFEEVVLINNAGYLGDIKYLGDIDHREFIKVMNVNVTAPAILMNAFIRSFKDAGGKKVIVNIGSGAGGTHMMDGGHIVLPKQRLICYQRWEIWKPALGRMASELYRLLLDLWIPACRK